MKEFSDNKKQQIPNNITFNNIQVTSPLQIANIANEYFITKIKNIRNSFKQSYITPMYILEKLIPKCKNDIHILFITINQTNDIIKNLKNSKSTGHDAINNRILKKIGHRIAPHLTHLINSILNTSIFPDIFKISRILPISKQGKPVNEISSFRPINNLVSIEKIVEEYLKIEITNHLNQNNIITKNHHGCRQKHSTTTALTQMYYNLHYNLEQNHYTAIYSTDLSSAYDTVDSKILLNKLYYYGIRGKTYDLMKSYLSNRKQYVSLETYNSTILDSNDCSTVQGSKLSGLLFLLYTNEIPLLPKLMTQETYFQITGKSLRQYDNIHDHTTINFVDDSTNLISFTNNKNISDYLSDFYTLLDCYYNMNKLQINPDKTNLVISCKNKLRQYCKNVSFWADTYEIKQKEKIKILGAYIQFNLSYDSHINYIVSKMSNRLNQLNNIKMYTSFKVRLSIINSMVIGVLLYILPLHLNCTNIQIKKLHKIVMRSAKLALGSACFKISNVKILQRCNWLSFLNLLRYSALIFIYKIKKNMTPQCIFEYFTVNKTKRVITKTYPVYDPKYKNFKNFIIFKGNSLFNELSDDIRCLPYKKYMKAVKQYVSNSFHPFKWSYDDGEDNDILD